MNDWTQLKFVLRMDQRPKGKSQPEQSVTAVLMDLEGRSPKRMSTRARVTCGTEEGGQTDPKIEATHFCPLGDFVNSARFLLPPLTGHFCIQS